MMWRGPRVVLERRELCRLPPISILVLCSSFLIEFFFILCELMCE